MCEPIWNSNKEKCKDKKKELKKQSDCIQILGRNGNYIMGEIVRNIENIYKNRNIIDVLLSVDDSKLVHIIQV